LIQLALLVAVHEHPALVDTLTVPVPPDAETEVLLGEMA
jgi:hypothetical protein